MALQTCLCICVHVETHIGSYTRLNYIDWHHIYQKGDGANIKHARCRRLYDQQITIRQGIFYGLPELDLAFSECQPAIQIVRHALFKRVFRVDIRRNKFERYTGCVSYVFIIQSMQWKSSEMCFGMNMRRLNKTKNVHIFRRFCFTCFFI